MPTKIRTASSTAADAAIKKALPRIKGLFMDFLRTVRLCGYGTAPCPRRSYPLSSSDWQTGFAWASPRQRRGGV
jgi:hypothetical protein